MSNSIEIIGVRLWGLASHADNGLLRYAVYYKRDGAMWRGLVDAEDELSAWQKFYKTVDGPDRMIYRLDEKEQEYVSEYGKS